MPYSCSDVAQVANKVASIVGFRAERTNSYPNWDEAKKNIEALRAKAHESDLNLAAFLRALARAKHYLDQKDASSLFGKTINSAERHDYLDFYFSSCIKHVNQLKSSDPRFAVVDLISGIVPQVARPKKNEPVSIIERILRKGDKQLTALVRDKEVDNFLASDEFKKLKKYQKDVLTTDIRSHSYLCGVLDLSVNKSVVLKTLIDDLETATNMAVVKQRFDQFYQGSGGTNTPYHILNTGQNITTRFFGLFGMRTTTISLIDDLASRLSPSTSEVIRI